MPKDVMGFARAVHLDPHPWCAQHEFRRLPALLQSSYGPPHLATLSSWRLRSRCLIATLGALDWNRRDATPTREWSPVPPLRRNGSPCSTGIPAGNKFAMIEQRSSLYVWCSTHVPSTSPTLPE